MEENRVVLARIVIVIVGWFIISVYDSDSEEWGSSLE